ncbi:molybdopterin-binding protein [Rathayibacter sp. VKM Ac-2630]|uniref:molybdopterin-binding protein n=1 Tax=Rathayibacter sp. VKM Ac-2630 TaxID=1938617 RepID=UPI0015715B83|nr:molybdopterin-binding protein [Rathayibacter sp. VKM Ac-2630]
MRRPCRVDLLLTGDEIDTEGAPVAGRVRDAFTPLLPSFVEGVGGAIGRIDRLGDDDHAVAARLTAGTAPIRLTTGGTGRSRADSVRRALTLAGAAVLVDGVDMRPGHPTMLAVLPGGALVIALPGNPLAALLAALSFLPPALDAAAGATPRASASEHWASRSAGRRRRCSSPSRAAREAGGPRRASARTCSPGSRPRTPSRWCRRAARRPATPSVSCRCHGRGQATGSSRTTTDLEVGVPLILAVESSGTSTLVSG